MWGNIVKRREKLKNKAIVLPVSVREGVEKLGVTENLALGLEILVNLGIIIRGARQLVEQELGPRITCFLTISSPLARKSTVSPRTSHRPSSINSVETVEDEGCEGGELLPGVTQVVDDKISL